MITTFNRSGILIYQMSPPILLPFHPLYHTVCHQSIAYTSDSAKKAAKQHFAILQPFTIPTNNLLHFIIPLL